jgi:hypothetical protein
MKLTTIALASVLAVTSSMALAQGASGAGTSGETAAGGLGTSTRAVGGAGSTGTAEMSNAVIGSSSLSSGFSTGTYPTVVTPGNLPSSLPAPGVVISR